MVRFAIALAQRKLAVFPCRPQDKRPATEHGCKDASNDPDVIQKWWDQEPAYNIGIATGSPSNMFAVDVDGLDAEIELRRLERELGALPATVEVITERGRHLYFQWQPEIPIGNSVGKIAPGIDVRGTGGYVLAPPSVHPSGRRYCWSVDSHNALAAAPDWLLAKIAAPDKRSGSIHISEWRQIVSSGVAEGARDCTIAKITGHLLRRRIDPIVVLELMKVWNEARCAPPLPARDVVRVVNSIAGRELRRREGDG
jgi:hypothetical protein